MCRSSRQTEESEDSLARSLSLLDKAEGPCEETEVNDAVARCWDPVTMGQKVIIQRDAEPPLVWHSYGGVSFCFDQWRDVLSL